MLLNVSAFPFSSEQPRPCLLKLPSDSLGVLPLDERHIYLPKNPDPSKVAILRTRTPVIQVQTLPFEGARILRATNLPYISTIHVGKYSVRPMDPSWVKIIISDESWKLKQIRVEPTVDGSEILRSPVNRLCISMFSPLNWVLYTSPGDWPWRFLNMKQTYHGAVTMSGLLQCCATHQGLSKFGADFLGSFQAPGDVGIGWMSVGWVRDRGK